MSAAASSHDLGEGKASLMRLCAPSAATATMVRTLRSRSLLPRPAWVAGLEVRMSALHVGCSSTAALEAVANASNRPVLLRMAVPKNTRCRSRTSAAPSAADTPAACAVPCPAMCMSFLQPSASMLKGRLAALPQEACRSTYGSSNCGGVCGEQGCEFARRGQMHAPLGWW